jgi:di/tricarboxylate transporter
LVVFTAFSIVIVVVVVALLPELPPMSGSDVVSVLVIIVGVGIWIVIVVIVVVVVVAILIVIVVVIFILIVPIFFLIGQTSDHKDKEGKEDCHQTANVPRKDKGIAQVDVAEKIADEAHFD